jgi:cephalosporin-C deacetylase-like acetyl esterase
MGITPGQWERVKELYEAALEYSPAERTGFLQRNERDDQVRTEVHRLLAEEEKLGSFLSTPPFADSQKSRQAEEQRILPGEILAARFRILAFIAAGGMGEVYKADDSRLDRIVALKFLPKELGEDRESLERFRREAKSASALNHPNICTVHDFGEEEGRAFIAMEYLEGETLSARIRRGPLSIDDTLNIAIAVAGALNTAHRKGIVHRDLKPGNIMLTETGPKLLDFGLAKYERPALSSEDTVSVLTGDGRIVGTLPYMSPEQLLGDEVGARGDIFAFGAVLYEMLTGKRAFERKSKSDTVAAIDREEPSPVTKIVKGVPEELERIIEKCLRKQAAKRYSSMAEIESELLECRALRGEPASGINLKVLLRRVRKPWVAVPVAASLLLLVGAAAWWIHRNSKVQWAREQALPQIEQLINLDKTADAFALATQVERYIPTDPRLVKAWDDISFKNDITSSPPGASVYWKEYAAPDSAWRLLGKTPIKGRRHPLVDAKWRFELPGYTTVERATFPWPFPFFDIDTHMDPEGKPFPGMVHVEITPDSQPLEVGVLTFPGSDALPTVFLNSFYLDRFEVTNAEFKKFVDQGGYQKQEYWKQNFEKDGHALSWADAMKLFVDKTGRPGPSGWIQGEYPKGQAEYPVNGVSWYEATAYAEFVGKALPTMYHWSIAASPHGSASILPLSNFAESGPAAVGKYRGISWAGVYDMAGNVKEWILNDTGSGKRYIMGGAWNEPTYTFFDTDARSPFDRNANFGFRCARYELNDKSAAAGAPLIIKRVDSNAVKPVSDQVFQAYRAMYSYDRTKLNEHIEWSKETEHWKVEKITFDAAYGKERMLGYLYLPKKGTPPFETILYFPGAAAVYEKSSEEDGVQSGAYEFIIKSGRAVFAPVYKGTYERGDDLHLSPKNTVVYRDHVIDWAKDLSRSVDYLETRSEIDHNKLGYFGISWGASIGALLPAVEERLKTLILVSAGFFANEQLPEVSQLNFAPRVKTPVLMLNGRFDYAFPINSSQEPLFRLLGTPQEQKRRVVYDTGHDLPTEEVIKETLNWLDRYLGPVK